MTAPVLSAQSPTPSPFELKSATVHLVAFTPHTADLAALELALQKLSRGEQGFFKGDAAVIDLTDWPASATALEFSGLLSVLRQAGLDPVCIRGGESGVQAGARASGLALLPASAARTQVQAEPVSVVAEPQPVAVEPPPQVRASALVIDKPVRSGQQVYARGGDLVVLGLVSHGAEVIADGNIHVYAPLRGRALAGARGDDRARIFTQCMEAELLSIAGTYRSITETLPQSLLSRPAQVRLEGSKLVIEALTF